MKALTVALFVIIGFALGGILFSYHLPKAFCHLDIVKLSQDSNPGTHNAMHFCGVPIGLMCLMLDMAKGYLPVHMALQTMDIADPWLAPVLLAPVLGHALAVFYPFKGGKAVAVSFGVLLGLAPQSWAVLALVVPYLLFTCVFVLHPNEKKTYFSFFCMALLCIAGGFFNHRASIALGASGIAAVTMWKNRVHDVELEKESITQRVMARRTDK